MLYTNAKSDRRKPNRVFNIDGQTSRYFYYFDGPVPAVNLVTNIFRRGVVLNHALSNHPLETGSRGSARWTSCLDAALLSFGIFWHVLHLLFLFGIRAFRYSDILTFGHSVVRAFGHSGIRTFKHSDIRTFEYSAIWKVGLLNIRTRHR